MKYKNKNNKTVIRTKKIAGNFTSITNKIIHDKQLSSNARLLIISILSDAESFDFKRTALRKRLGFTEYKLDNAIKELVEYGYLKKTMKYGQFFHYTISEYGNLNIDEKDSEEISDTNETNSKEEADSTHYMDSEQFQQDWKQLTQYFSEREHYVNFEILKETIPNVQCRNDVFELRRNQDKEIKKNKIKHYKAVEEFVMSGYASKELKPKILKEVRRLITDEHKKPSADEVNKIRHKISHNKYKNKVKKHGFDYETQLVDNYENPLD